MPLDIVWQIQHLLQLIVYYSYLYAITKGNVFTSTTSATPTTGEFYYDTTTTTVEFAAADIGTEVAIDVVTTSSDVIEIYSDASPYLPTFQVVILGEQEDYQESVIYDTSYKLDRVNCSNCTPPVKK